MTPDDELPQKDEIKDPKTILDVLPVNPIDFYDNDDGFWDEFIAKKKKKFNKVPIYPDREFIKH